MDTQEEIKETLKSIGNMDRRHFVKIMAAAGLATAAGAGTASAATSSAKGKIVVVFPQQPSCSGALKTQTLQ